MSTFIDKMKKYPFYGELVEQTGQTRKRIVWWFSRNKMDIMNIEHRSLYVNMCENGLMKRGAKKKSK